VSVNPEIFVLEWSKSQKCFHIDSFAKCLKINLEAAMLNYNCDYIPIFMGTEDECDRVADQLGPKLIPNYPVPAQDLNGDS